MVMSLLEFYLQLRIQKEAGQWTKDMEEVCDEEEQRLKDLDNPHAVIRYGKQTEAENVPAINN